MSVSQYVLTSIKSQSQKGMDVPRYLGILMPVAGSPRYPLTSFRAHLLKWDDTLAT